MMKVISYKRRDFALHFVRAGGDIEVASKAAKITLHKAKAWLKKNDVQDFIKDLNTDIEKVCKINKAVIVQKHLDIHKQTTQKIIDSNGNKVLANPGAANKALENVSTLMGYNSPTKVDVTTDLSSWLTAQATPKQIIETEVIEDE